MFQLLGTSALRSRLGVAVVLAIIVFGVVGIARVVSGPDGRSAGVFPAVDSSSTATTDPEEADDGVVEPRPVTSTAVDPGPSLSPGAQEPAEIAKAFATSWLDRTAKVADWYAALVPHTTAGLAAKLKGVDPVVVPAERLTGTPTVVPRGTGLVEVSYPVDSGTLLLRVVVADGRWLVDGVDWDRS
ncbi:hypothetical protein [Asanoa hainanensis]|uniref:hypothetical protein n=1 Tax=Asanoa hainanensis TaxID=560556 RepID=UPI001FE379C3|nr:hypothetical protein [Asanoa hainanensis]